MSRTSLRRNPHTTVWLNVKKLLTRKRRHIWSLSDSNEIRTHNQIVCKGTINHLAKLTKMIEMCCEYLSVRCVLLYVNIMSGMSFGVSPQSLICQNVKEVLAPTRQHYWILSDNNEIQTQNHRVRKRTLNHLPKVAKWLSYVVSTYLYGVFDTMLLSCHVRASEYIYTL